jgi:hypothetical protein
MGDIRTTEPLILTVRSREFNAAAVLTGGGAFNARFTGGHAAGRRAISCVGHRASAYIGCRFSLEPF